MVKRYNGRAGTHVVYMLLVLVLVLLGVQGCAQAPNVEPQSSDDTTQEAEESAPSEDETAEESASPEAAEADSEEIVSPEAADADTEETAPTEAEEGEPVELVVPVRSEPRTLSPNFQYDAGGFPTYGNVFSQLVAVDWGVMEGTLVYGDLAETWESEDGLVYTFHLYEDAQWHDGEPVTSEDVKWSLDTIIENNYPNTPYLPDVKEITTPDEHTVVIELNEPNVAFPVALGRGSNWHGKILPKHIYEDVAWDDAEAFANPVGSGPFKFVEWVPGSHVRLEKNPDYFRGPPTVDTLIFRLIPDQTVGYTEFMAGAFPYLPRDYAPPWAEIKQIQETRDDLDVYLTPAFISRALYFNLDHEILSNLQVRQAIAYAVDREEINEKAFAGLGIPTYYAGVPDFDAFLNEDAVFPEHDLEMAEELLDEAGYPRGDDGIRFTVRITNPASIADTVPATEVLIEQLSAVGIEAVWERFDQPTWQTAVSEGDYDITTYFVAYGPDPDAYREHFGTDGARNFPGYSNPEVDELLAEGRQVSDVERRQEIYGQVQEILVEDIPHLPLYEEVNPTIYQKGWTGFAMQPTGFTTSISWFGFYAVQPPTGGQ